MTSPRALRCYFNWLVKEGLRAPREGWMRAIADASYDGVQFIEPLSLSHQIAVTSRHVCIRLLSNCASRMIICRSPSMNCGYSAGAEGSAIDA